MKTAGTVPGIHCAEAAVGGIGSRLAVTVQGKIIFAAHIKGFLSTLIRGWKKCVVRSFKAVKKNSRIVTFGLKRCLNSDEYMRYNQFNKQEF